MGEYVEQCQGYGYEKGSKELLDCIAILENSHQQKRANTAAALKAFSENNAANVQQQNQILEKQKNYQLETPEKPKGPSTVNCTATELSDEITSVRCTQYD